MGGGFFYNKGHMWKKYLVPCLIVSAFGLGAFSVWVLPQKSTSRLDRQACNDKFPFLSHSVNCQTIDDKADQIENLHSEVTNIIAEGKAAHHIVRASVFFRDLDSKRWFGVNDTDKFYPASLIKLPIAVLYYKIAELEPGVFDRQIQIPADTPDNSDQHYPPVEPLQPGKTYTVREMIRHMIVYSDNAPFKLLADAGSVLRDKVLSDLGIYEPPAGEGEGAWSVTTRVYGGIFRALYNASYLNIAYSNELLEMLSQTTFTRGIVAGVPREVRVAHKFGEAEGVSADGQVVTHVLNDCGIVYKPNDPFILCIMTEGSNYDDMEKTIQKIATSSYQAIE